MADKLSFTRKVATAAWVSLLIAGLFCLLVYTFNFFLLVFASLLFGVLLSSLSHFFHNKLKLKYGLSLVLVLLLLFGTLGITIWLLAPSVSQQADQLSQSLPQALSELKVTLSQTNWGRQLMQGIPDKPGKWLLNKSNAFSQLTGVFSSTLGVVANIIIILITGIYLASNPGNYRKGFTKLFNPSYRPRITDVLDKCYHTMSSWLLSRFISMVVVGVATWAGLHFLGISLPVVLAIIAAFLNFIPNLGPYLALLPALPIAYLAGPDKALYVFILYMGIQTLEGYILTPLLDKKLISMPPALLLFGQVLLGILVGIVGILLASPIIAVLIVIVNELYVKDQLESNKEQPAN